MLRDLKSSVIAVVVLTLVFGLAIPALFTGFAQVAFSSQADGSLIKVERQGRRLAAGGAGVHEAAVLPRAAVRDRARLQRRRDDLRQPRADEPRSRQERAAAGAAILKLERPYNPGLTIHDIPVDAVTTSGSGIDPDISPAYAQLQSRRVAAVRHLPLATVQQLISDNTDGRSLGFFGEPGVNVLELNLALDKEQGSVDGAQAASVFSREHRARGDPRLVPEARPAAAGAEPGDVHRRARQRDHDRDLLPRARARPVRTSSGSSA